MSCEDRAAVVSAVCSGNIPPPMKSDAPSSPMDREQTTYRTATKAAGFTLAELVVTLGVLAVIVVLGAQLLKSAATVTTLGHKQMDADSQARQVLDRMAVDFAQMVKRPDVDYFLKSSSTATPDCTTCTSQVGNDQIAFFASTPGYYPTPTSQSPISLVAYRVNSDPGSSSRNTLQRMGKGFVWNGASSSFKPILFLDSNSAPTTTIKNTWCQATISGTPSATCAGTPDPDYEVTGPQVFRFEYYYLLKNGGFPPSFSATPWNGSLGHTNVKGMQDVAAIIVDIAVIDPKSKILVTNAQITSLSAQLIDYSSGMVPGQLRTAWQNALNAIPSNPDPALRMPAAAISGIRLYERFIYLSPP